MFKIGENVVHPLYGAGIIVDFNTENMYELELDNGKMTMFVPSDTIEQVGIRHVYSVAQIDALLKTLQAEGSRLIKIGQGAIKTIWKKSKAVT